jgi:hypothetical protein
MLERPSIRNAMTSFPTSFWQLGIRVQAHNRRSRFDFRLGDNKAGCFGKLTD